MSSVTSVVNEYSEYPELYDALLKNVELRLPFQMLKQAGFEYSQCPDLYHALMNNPNEAIILGSRFKILKQAGFEYRECSKLYDALIKNPGDAVILASGVKMLKEVGFEYSACSELYDALINNPGDAVILALGFKALKEIGFAYGQCKKFSDILIKNYNDAVQLGARFKSLEAKLKLALKILQDLGIKNDSPFYNALVFQPDLANGLAYWTQFSKTEQQAWTELMHMISNREDAAALFVEISSSEIMQRIHMMGKDALNAVKQAMTGDAPSLQRFRNQFFVFSPVVEKNLIQLYAKLMSKEEKEAFERLLLVLSATFFACNGKQEEEESITAMLTQEEFVLTEKIKELSKWLLIKIIGNEKFKKIDASMLEDIIKRVGNERLAKLSLGSRHMENDRYQAIYINILALYFLQESPQTVYDFLHDINQQDEPGRSLAAHNQKIQTRLREGLIQGKGIKADSATHYKQKLRFTISSEKGSSLKNKAQLLARMASKGAGEGKKFEEAIASLKALPLNEEMKKMVDSIEKLLMQLQKTYLRNKQKFSAIDPILKSIRKKIKALDDYRSKLSTSLPEALVAALNSYDEFKQHFLDVYSEYEAIEYKPEKDSAEKMEIAFSFRVEQFSKYTLETLFLGNEVGCCLGLGSPQFQAMVQRILDDAMLFHVAVDEETGKAAALIWLYFAECEDGSIALVANFFEINGKYARYPVVKEGLLKGLLEFTSQYCKDNNIPHFYMNQLSYGEYMGSLNCYPITPMTLKDKVGGPYIPGHFDYRDTSRTTEVYYVASLHQNSFHVFSDAILDAKEVPGYTIILEMSEKESVVNASSSAASPVSLASSSHSLFSSSSSSKPQKIQLAIRSETFYRV